MSLADRVWDALSNIVKLNDRVVGLSSQVKEMAGEMRDMDKRIVRLETALEIALAPGAQVSPKTKKSLPRKKR